MAFNRPYANGFPIRRPTLRELVKAIQGNEKRGYECIAPYKKIYKQGKKFESRPRLINGMSFVKDKQHFVESFDYEYYEVWMKKVN